MFLFQYMRPCRITVLSGRTANARFFCRRPTCSILYIDNISLEAQRAKGMPWECLIHSPENSLDSSTGNIADCNGGLFHTLYILTTPREDIVNRAYQYRLHIWTGKNDQ